LLTYLEAVLRVYNEYGRRDNIWKARIKVIVKAMGPTFVKQVEDEFAALLENDGDGVAPLITQAEFDRVSAFFQLPAGVTPLPEGAPHAPAPHDTPLAYRRWLERNVHGHRLNGYRAVTLSLKRAGQAPGDVTDTQMELAADLADRYSAGELRVTHQQNLVLPWVREADLFVLWQAARDASFATPNIGLLTDMICCPGGDVCSLANARSIPVSARITERFDDLDELYDSRRHRAEHQRVHQLLRPPPQRPHRCARRRQGRRRVVPDHAGRLRRLAEQRPCRAGQGDRPRLHGGRSARRGRGADRHLPRAPQWQRALRRHRTAASGSSRSRPPRTPRASEVEEKAVLA